MSRNRVIFLCIIVALFLASVLAMALHFVFQSNLFLRDRNDYRNLDLSSFNQAYEAARANQSDWAKDPKEVALRLASYPNLDNSKPDMVKLFEREDGRVSVVIQETGLINDSVEASEIRVDLIQVEDVWEVEWAGGRWRCQPFRGRGQVWSKELCP